VKTMLETYPAHQVQFKTVAGSSLYFN